MKDLSKLLAPVAAGLVEEDKILMKKIQHQLIYVKIWRFMFDIMQFDNKVLRRKNLVGVFY